jgi:predicted kinase
MPRLRKKFGPLGIALTVWDVYRRLPPAQRKQLLNLARKYGPAVATKVMLLRRASAKKP